MIGLFVLLLLREKGRGAEEAALCSRVLGTDTGVLQGAIIESVGSLSCHRLSSC